MLRKCNECTLCCRLLPVSEINKPANTRCPSQRHTGCSVYATRPMSCRVWSCIWLLDTELISRPDITHYVIDPSRDYIEMVHDDGLRIKTPVVQIWVDPQYPKAHENPELRAWLDKHKEIGLIRYNSQDSLAIFPPSLTGKGWLEKGGIVRSRKR
jgi:hypothetical protein